MESQSTPPSPDHVEFDLLCSEVDEFETLPSVVAPHPEPRSETEEQASLDGQILAGLVTP